MTWSERGEKAGWNRFNVWVYARVKADVCRCRRKETPAGVLLFFWPNCPCSLELHTYTHIAPFLKSDRPLVIALHMNLSLCTFFYEKHHETSLPRHHPPLAVPHPPASHRPPPAMLPTLTPPSQSKRLRRAGRDTGGRGGKRPPPRPCGDGVCMPALPPPRDVGAVVRPAAFDASGGKGGVWKMPCSSSLLSSSSSIARVNVAGCPSGVAGAETRRMGVRSGKGRGRGPQGSRTLRRPWRW